MSINKNSKVPEGLFPEEWGAFLGLIFASNSQLYIQIQIKQTLVLLT